ncbi:hypothetical protein B0O99DRAFT_591416 [Bisporella sp. PMI_857]|nr:hypothetical protein B0O99DRAFT_591416 [Bisporella sp. PMI_857]
MAIPAPSPAPPGPKPPATEPQCKGMGVLLKNARSTEEKYYFYNNLWNGDGTAGPQMDFSKPDQVVSLGPNEEKHVPLDSKFKGRIQRGNKLGGTWAEFQTSADNDPAHAAHGDISIQQGCDGAATIQSTCTGSKCGGNVIGGFDWDPFKGADDKALYWPTTDGRKVLDSTEGNWERQPNTKTIDHLNKVVGQINAYIKGGSGTRDIASPNGCLRVVFY